ncbi:hypothetical protein [Emticicia sp. W12TSBA100-4]|uniref:hypothetical protein n=1 Tax=Emticicia sp. W12TSBA100-4 TaxID=3160965 RepID=UPI0033064DA2
MKKKTFLIFILILFSVYSNAQTKPNSNYYSFGFGIATNIPYPNKVSLLGNIHIGFLRHERLMFGMTLPYSTSSLIKAYSSTTQYPIDTIDRTIKNAKLIAPFLRYYLTNKKFRLYIQGDINSWLFKSDIPNLQKLSNSIILGLSANVGVEYFYQNLGLGISYYKPLMDNSFKALPVYRENLLKISLNIYTRKPTKITR